MVYEVDVGVDVGVASSNNNWVVLPEYPWCDIFKTSQSVLVLLTKSTN